MMDYKKKADLILHPIRMRILMALAEGPKTTQELVYELPDVPQATLYRHINRLAKAMVIQVVEERKVRGSIEKVYAMEEHMGTLSVEEVAHFSKDDHLRYFIAFTTSLVDDFSRYLQHSTTVDLAADSLAYQKFPLELSDDELRALSSKINAAFTKYRHNQPGMGRRRRIFSFVVMPDVGGSEK
jgi:DNA-binding transcriptional ArsR family regulator